VDKIRALWDAAKANDVGGEIGLLQAMVPMPNELNETTSPSGNPNWYDWRVANWGTKWDIGTEGLEFVEGENGRAQISGWADSAWSPPLDAFQTYALANEDCSLELKYFEPGMSFVGVWDSEGGDAYWDNVGTLLDTTEEDDAVLYELLEWFNVWDWFDTDEDEEVTESKEG
jgi:hypothetical protein